MPVPCILFLSVGTAAEKLYRFVVIGISRPITAALINIYSLDVIMDFIYLFECYYVLLPVKYAVGHSTPSTFIAYLSVKPILLQFTYLMSSFVNRNRGTSCSVFLVI